MMTTLASFDFNRRVLLSTLALLPALIGPLRPKSAVAQTNILQSWSDGPAKTSIIDFVARVITQGGPDFVPAEQRIAVYDNDGTLWCEQPMYSRPCDTPVGNSSFKNHRRCASGG